METVNKEELSKVREVQRRVEENAQLIERLVNQLVKDHCGPLDDYMQTLRSIIVDDKEHPPTDVELDDFALTIPVLLYFSGEAQEALGIKEDIAKAVRQEIYNNVYAVSAGTISDKTASAELASQSEQIAHIVYQRAYKKIKLRMEAASEMLQSVKKVISRRMQGYELSNVDPARIGGM